MLRYNSRTFESVEEGIISTEHIAEGRFIPAIVIDFEGAQDIIELLQLHKTSGGDATSQWARDYRNRDNFLLMLKFTKPMQLDFAIKFSIEKHHSILDGIFQSKGLYIVNGKKGLKVSTVELKEWVFIEVPTTDAKQRWEQLFTKLVVKKFKVHTKSKKEAKELMKDFITQSREIWKYRKNK